jgi:hypothetical protein
MVSESLYSFVGLFVIHTGDTKKWPAIGTDRPLDTPAKSLSPPILNLGLLRLRTPTQLNDLRAGPARAVMGRR